jgi:hypothetical protein
LADTVLHPVQGANHRVDGSFIATILETAAVVVLYFAWRSITEGASFASLSWSGADEYTTESWDDDQYNYYRN